MSATGAGKDSREHSNSFRQGSSGDFASAGRRTWHLFPPENSDDQAGTVPSGAQGENAVHHSGSLPVHRQLALGIPALLVAIMISEVIAAVWYGWI